MGYYPHFSVESLYLWKKTGRQLDRSHRPARGGMNETNIGIDTPRVSMFKTKRLHFGNFPPTRKTIRYLAVSGVGVAGSGATGTTGRSIHGSSPLY